MKLQHSMIVLALFSSLAMAENCPSFSGQYKVADATSCRLDQLIHCGLGSDDSDVEWSRISYEKDTLVNVVQNQCNSVKVNDAELPLAAANDLEKASVTENSVSIEGSQWGSATEDGVWTGGHKSISKSITKNEDGSIDISGTCRDQGLILVVPVIDNWSANCHLVPVP